MLGGPVRSGLTASSDQEDLPDLLRYCESFTGISTVLKLGYNTENNNIQIFKYLQDQNINFQFA